MTGDQKIRNLGELEPGEVLKDGQGIRVPFTLMDGSKHWFDGDPVAVIAAAARRAGGEDDMTNFEAADAAYDEYERRIQDAWKDPARQPNQPAVVHFDARPSVNSPTEPHPADALEGVYEDYERRICDAWRSR